MPGDRPGSQVTPVELPDPVARPGRPAGRVDTGALEQDLRSRVDGEVRFDAGSRGAYSTDASNYRQVPIGVVVPRTIDAAAEAVAVCREHGAPLVTRGAGTSLAGQGTNAAVVVDFAKYCHRLLSVDAEARTCWVEPGIVLDELNGQLAPYGLSFGPEPATHGYCTLGGMIGNNSCGATAQRTGKTVDNVVRLDVLLYDGSRLEVGETSDQEYADIVRSGGRPAEIYRQLRALRDRYGDEVRARYPDIPRRVSGYDLDSLLSEKNFHVAQALVGSEGTCVVVLRAQLRLLPVVPAYSLVLLGYPDVGSSGDDVPREEHSTRGRSRVLFEMLQGHPDSPIGDGWGSEAVRDALDLCLACKGCKKDCPVNVDMATYKAEFLAHHYAGRLRPLAPYSMGWLPAIARVATRLPRLVSFSCRTQIDQGAAGSRTPSTSPSCSPRPGTATRPGRASSRRRPTRSSGC